jgi:hypothetical protein
VFTARYALSPYIKQMRFVFKGLTKHVCTRKYYTACLRKWCQCFLGASPFSYLRCAVVLAIAALPTQVARSHHFSFLRYVQKDLEPVRHRAGFFRFPHSRQSRDLAGISLHFHSSFIFEQCFRQNTLCSPVQDDSFATNVPELNSQR